MSETPRPWPQADLEAVPYCPVCGSAERAQLYADLSDCAFDVAPGKWTLYLCASCKSAWLDPRPTEASIGNAYESYYTHVAEDDASKQSKSAFVRLLHAWLNDYKNTYYGLSRNPSEFGGRWLVRLVPSLRAKANSQCRHLPRPPSDGGRLLDVGFGNGGFLKLAGEMGWNAEGIDFDPKAVEVARARGLNVSCISAAELAARENQYDIITISHVIEHVHEPVALLRELHRLLKPGGRLWLETPNLQSSGSKKYGLNWRGLEPPRHLVLFTLDSLRMSLEGIGFISIKQHWHGLESLAIYAQSAAIVQGQRGQEAVQKAKLPLSAILAELQEMFRARKREYITLTANKAS